MQLNPVYFPFTLSFSIRDSNLNYEYNNAEVNFKDKMAIYHRRVNGVVVILLAGSAGYGRTDRKCRRTPGRGRESTDTEIGEVTVQSEC
jgi:hypothetical protein